MGHIQSTSAQDLSPGITPTSYNWITSHAHKTGLKIYEIQRLWDQFRQLGASTVNGRLNTAVLAGPNFTSFTSMFMQSIPQSQGQISFVDYCLACKNLQNSSSDDKLRAIFHIYNRGNNWNSATLRKLVQSVYPDENDEVIRATTETLMSQFTFGRQDYVTELEFMRLMLEFDDSDVVKSCLSYKIIPNHLASQLQDEALSDFMPSPHSGPRAAFVPPHPDSATSDDESYPSNEQLKRVASQLSEPKRDWRRVLNILGFTESEISLDEEKNFGDKYEVVLKMLIQWRDSGPGTSLELKEALMNSNNEDIANRTF